MTVTEPTVDDLKQVEYYGAMVHAWIDTRMERDRTIVTLSAGAIGLLVTLLTTVGVPSGCVLLFYIVAFLGFGVALTAALWIFSANATYLEQVADRERQEAPDRTLLGRLDGLMLGGLAAGVVFSIALGIAAALARHSPYSPLERLL